MTELYNECSGIEGYYQALGSPLYVRFERTSCLPFPWSKGTFRHMVVAYNVALRTGMLRYCCSPFHDDLPRSAEPSPHCTVNTKAGCGEEPIPRSKYEGEKYVYYIPPSDHTDTDFVRPIPERSVPLFVPIPPGLHYCSSLTWYNDWIIANSPSPQQRS